MELDHHIVGRVLGQWEYRVFEKPIIVLIIVDFTSVYRVFLSGAFSVTKTDLDR